MSGLAAVLVAVVVGTVLPGAHAEPVEIVFESPSPDAVELLYLRRDAETSARSTRVVTVTEAEKQGAEPSGDSSSPSRRVASPPTAPAPHPCDTIPNPGPVYLTDATMRWCPLVADHLAAYDWQPGDLRRLMLLVECESNGDPTAVNPTSGTTGLFQHMPRYFAARSMKALGYVGDPTDPHDNIHVGVWLAKTGGWQHWSCDSKIASSR